MKVKTIVVGYDGSPDARRALEAAAELAADDTIVHVVEAYQIPSSYEMAEFTAALPAEFKDTIDLLEPRRRRLIEAEALLEQRGVDHEAHFINAKAAEAILDVAEEVDANMIIVGSRGLGRASRFLRGSVSSRIATHADRTFLVLHEGESA